MIKVEVIKKKDRISFVFETRDRDQEGLDKFDELYAMVFGSMLKEGGYMDTNKFHVDINLPEEDDGQ